MDFIISLYDLFANGPLMDDLLDERIDLFGPLLWTMFGVTLVSTLIFYYVLNNQIVTRSDRFSKTSYWIIALIVSMLIVFVSHLVTCLQMADKLIPRNPGASPKQVTFLFDQPDSVFFGFALQVAGLSIVLFFLLSMALKWGSSHASNKPF